MNQQLIRDVRDRARTLHLSVDREVYEKAGRDPLEPLLSSPELGPDVGVFGRDPGKDEIKEHQPLVGAAGKRVRTQISRALGRGTPADLKALLGVSRYVFFSNTVPYKPIGNRAWSREVRLEFLPSIAELLVDHWKGHHLITLGNQALTWFDLAAEAGLGRAPECESLAEAWKQPDAFEKKFKFNLKSPRTGKEKVLYLYPLPHPSPLNVKWFKKFPALLEGRLQDLKKYLPA